jgi:uncharacterized membrane protein (DUF2068 family)
MLHAIAVFKLVKAAILIAVAIGAFNLLGGDAAEDIKRWSHALHMHGRYVDEIAAKIGGFSEHELAAIGFGTLVYAAVFLTEGIGLWLRAVWAEYLTLLVTTSFLPFEIYEAGQNGTPTRILTIVVNLLVILYLVMRLERDHHWPFRKHQPGHP